VKVKLAKNCYTCQRDFHWRKKWAKDWHNVKYCSKRCRRRKNNLIASISYLIPNLDVINTDDLEILLRKIKYIHVIYPGAGKNLDLINKFSHQNEININYI
tara:strand:+ start:758 stop:1060 length:303 start_codon:yes stop_codon:yes gene_type:complete